MDTGREFTERWHHQMQIRDAVGAPLLLNRRWLTPVLDLSVRALPRAFAASHVCEPGTAVVLRVRRDRAWVWSVVCQPSGWTILRGCADDPAASLRTDPDVVWRLFFGMLPVEEARGLVEIAGQASLAEPMLHARAVMV